MIRSKYSFPASSRWNPHHPAGHVKASVFQSLQDKGSEKEYQSFKFIGHSWKVYELYSLNIVYSPIS